MEEKMAREAITFLAAQAIETGNRRVSILFHGQGEPTLNWPVLTATVEYARRYLASRNIEVKFSIATNGMLNKEKRIYLATNMDSVAVSLDGYRLIHDRQRPTLDDRSTFQTVFESAQFFHSRSDRLSFGIRATLLPERIDCLPAIARFFGRHFPNSAVTVEPVSFAGRYRGVSQRSFAGFALSYRRAKREAGRQNLNFRYSAAYGPRKSQLFCGLAGRTLVCGPAGFVSSCLRVGLQSDPHAAVFGYGSCVPGKGVIIDLSQKEMLKGYAASCMPECQGCIAYTWCQGDCRHVRLVHNGAVTSGVSPLCREIRTIVVGELLDTIMDNTEADKLIQLYYQASV